MNGKKLTLALCVIFISVSLGIISRFAVEFFGFKHENNRDIPAYKNEVFEIEADIYFEDYNTISEDNAEIETQLSTENRRLPGKTARAAQKNKSKTQDIDLSMYHVNPRKSDSYDLIPRSDVPVRGVIRAGKNRPAKDMYLDDTQKNYITIPIESIDIRWIKRIWEQ